MKKGVSTGFVIAIAGACLSGIIGGAIDHTVICLDGFSRVFNNNVRISNKNTNELFDRVEELEKTVKELTTKEGN